MGEIYTSGNWVVKEGREQEFVDARARRVDQGRDRGGGESPPAPRPGQPPPLPLHRVVGRCPGRRGLAGLRGVPAAD
jgi:hypothetical protein